MFFPCINHAIIVVDKQAKDASQLDKELLKELNEKEVEIDHLQTTVVSLSQKMEVKIMSL